MDTVKSFVLAVVDQFLKRHGFVTKKEENLPLLENSPLRRRLKIVQEGSARSLARSHLGQGTQSHRDSAPARDGSASRRHHTRLEEGYLELTSVPPPQLVPRKRLALSEINDTPSRPANRIGREVFEDSGLAGDEESRGRLTVESSGKRHKWIEDIVAVRLFHLNIVGADLVGSQHRSLAILTFHLPSTHHLQGSAPTGSKRPKSPEGQYPLL